MLIVVLVIAGSRIKAALNSASRVQSDANRLAALSDGRLGSSYLIAKNLREALDAVPRAPMLEVHVNATSVEFQYVVGSRAAGFTANTVQPELIPEQVTLDGSASPRSRAFPLSIVRADVPSRLVRAVRRQPGLSDFELDAETLAMAPIDRRVEWTISGTGGGHNLNFTALPDGRHLRVLPQ